MSQGTVLQGLIALNDDSYAWENWQGTLLVIAIIVFSVFFNTVLAARLPFIEGVLLVLHVAGLFAVVIPLWVMGPRGNAHEVLLEVVDGGQWHSKGLSFMIGLPVMTAMLYVSPPFTVDPYLVSCSPLPPRVTTALSTCPKRSRMPPRRYHPRLCGVCGRMLRSCSSWA